MPLPFVLLVLALCLAFCSAVPLALSWRQTRRISRRYTSKTRRFQKTKDVENSIRQRRGSVGPGLGGGSRLFSQVPPGSDAPHAKWQNQDWLDITTHYQQQQTYTKHRTHNTRHNNNNNNNNNNTIWGGSVLTGEEPPLHSGELKHALLQAGGPTQSQLSRPMSSGHHISMEHRLRRKHLNSDTNAIKKNI